MENSQWILFLFRIRLFAKVSLTWPGTPYYWCTKADWSSVQSTATIPLLPSRLRTWLEAATTCPFCRGSLLQSWCEKRCKVCDVGCIFRSALAFLWMCYFMDVSENSGTPKSSILIGISIINHPFWGTPIFGNWLLEMIDWIFRDAFQLEKVLLLMSAKTKVF